MVAATKRQLKKHCTVDYVMWHVTQNVRAYPGSDGDANPSGWMKEDTFCKFLTHFVRNTRPTKEHPVLLLVDNHFSHLSLNARDYATANGIIMLSFPPHCTHKLQRLDRTVYGPFKKAVKRLPSTVGWSITLEKQ